MLPTPAAPAGSQTGIAIIVATAAASAPGPASSQRAVTGRARIAPASAALTCRIPLSIEETSPTLPVHRANGYRR